MLPVRTIRPGLIALWMLNDASTVREKVEFMRACRGGGIEGLCMHPRSGNLIPYGSDEWFDMIRALVEEGRRLGIDMWLYDEDPYPSGVAGGLVTAERAELRARYMALHEKPHDLRAGQLWRISESKVLWAGLVPVAESLPAVDMTARVGMVRSDWFMGDWDSRYYYPDTPVFPCPRGDAVRPFYTLRVPHVPIGYRLIAISAELASEEGSWGSLPDLLNPESFGLFRKLTLDRYHACVGEQFGLTIPGIFTDEAKAHGGMPITKDLFEDFERTFGYSLRERLYQLFGNALSDDYIQARLDYRRWVATRFLDAFMRPYRRWCDEHGLYLVGHISPEDDPIQEAVCVGSVMPIMKELSLPGTDIIVPFTGDWRAPALNLGSLRVGSLKSQHGRPYAMSETLALCGWSVTSDRCRQLFAWQKVLGVDRFFVHGFFMSSEGVQNYEAPPDYGPHSSIFRGICAVNDWLKAVEGILDGACDDADVAVLSSLVSFWTWGGDMNSPRLGRLRRSLWQTVLACLRAHVAVHMVSEEDVSEGSVEADQLRVGERAYRTVLVPAIDVVGQGALGVLQSAADAGVSVFWFGTGPGKLISRAGRLRDCAARPGETLRQPYPSVSWCRARLTPAAAISGRNSEECYVRRLRARDGQRYLLAVNVCDESLALRLGMVGAGGAWLPVNADGEAVARVACTAWRVPGRGCGLFRLGPAPQAVRRAQSPVRRPTGAGRTFERLRPNILRLYSCRALRRGQGPVKLDYPRPYWQVFNDYSARRTWPTYLGELPLESSVPEGKLRYAFGFKLRGRVRQPSLVFDPRCARGRFEVLLNGKRLRARLVFPLDGTRPLRLRASHLREGLNRLELVFSPQGAMDGLLSQIYLEGEFDVTVRHGRAVVSPPSGRISEKGWQAAGLPHYMGEGRYRWTESFSPADLESSWTLQVERIVDSAQLRVNGASMGVRAWAPWRWPLSGLKEGPNVFELIVSGTAGNRHELRWPDQPQGWIGGAWLVAMRCHSCRVLRPA